MGGREGWRTGGRRAATGTQKERSENRDPVHAPVQSYTIRHCEDTPDRFRVSPCSPDWTGHAVVGRGSHLLAANARRRTSRPVASHPVVRGVPGADTASSFAAPRKVRKTP